MCVSILFSGRLFPRVTSNWWGCGRPVSCVRKSTRRCSAASAEATDLEVEAVDVHEARVKGGEGDVHDLMWEKKSEKMRRGVSAIGCAKQIIEFIDAGRQLTSVLERALIRVAS